MACCGGGCTLSCFLNAWISLQNGGITAWATATVAHRKKATTKRALIMERQFTAISRNKPKLHKQLYPYMPLFCKFVSKRLRMSVHEMEKAFQDKIDAEIRIEPKDWMPEKY